MKLDNFRLETFESTRRVPDKSRRRGKQAEIPMIIEGS